MQPIQIALAAAAGALAMGALVAMRGWLDSPGVSGLAGVLLGTAGTWAVTTLNAAAERRHQLRLAAIERRLAAHQQAYALWRKLCGSFHSEQPDSDVVGESQSWWYENCLYLDASARAAFYEAYSAVATMRMLSGPSTEEKRGLWSDLARAGPIIERGAGLPSIGESEEQLKKPVGS